MDTLCNCGRAALLSSPFTAGPGAPAGRAGLSVFGRDAGRLVTFAGMFATSQCANGFDPEASVATHSSEGSNFASSQTW
jgi:hypothetical protein